MRIGPRAARYAPHDASMDKTPLDSAKYGHSESKTELVAPHTSALAADDVLSGEVVELPLHDSDDDSMDEEFQGLEISSSRGRDQSHEQPKETSGLWRQRSRAHSESARNNYSEQTGEPIIGRHPAIDPRVYRRGEARYPLLQITVDELAGDNYRSDGSAVVVSPVEGSTAPSSLTRQTIPEHDTLDPNISSPMSTAATSFSTRRDSSSPRPGRLQRSASSIISGIPTGRRPRRRTSTRSSSPSASPASMFLSHWSGASGNRPATPEPDAEGQKIGNDQEYTLGKQIGYGGFSVIKEVFKNEQEGHPSQKATLAVKILRKSAAGKDDHDRQRFCQQVEHNICIWRRLKHERILPLLDDFETSWAKFCVMPLLTGGTLLDLMHKCRKATLAEPSAAKQGVPTPQVKKYLSQLAAAVSYLHQEVKIVHGDIKLENCLLNDKDNLLLCDFGMAEFIDIKARESCSPAAMERRSLSSGGSTYYDSDSDDARPNSGMGPSETSTSVTGSLPTASPELIRASKPLHRPCIDIWAFGVVSYTLMVGRAPFVHSFVPKLQMMILRGDFERDAVQQVLRAKQLLEHEVDAATELVNHCMDMDARRRWTISQVEASPFFQQPTN